MLKLLLIISALFISACAAWFSVIGISSLYVGAPLGAILMALSFELAKLVAASFTYRYWKSVSKILRTYMLAAVIIISCITSAGIYGYLSAAYASSAKGFNEKQNTVQMLATRQKSDSMLISSNEQRIANLQRYRAQQENRLDSLIGKTGFLTQQRIIRIADSTINALQTRNAALTEARDSLELAKTNVANEAQADTRIGTFWYVAQMLGQPLDRIVKYFTLIIVIVFDPMALSLLLAFNFLIKGKKPESVDSEAGWMPSRLSWLKAQIPRESVYAPVPAAPEISEPKSNMPYYAHPDYNWDADNRWETDPEALRYKEQISHGVRVRNRS